MKVEELMCKEVGWITTDDATNEAARIMWECDCGIVPVVTSGETKELAGVITDRDICMAAYTQGKTLAEIPVSSVMAREVLSCTPGDAIASVEARMRNAQIRRLPVVDAEGHLIGMISLADIARESSPTRRPQRGAAIDSREVGATLASITQPHAMITH